MNKISVPQINHRKSLNVTVTNPTTEKRFFKSVLLNREVELQDIYKLSEYELHLLIADTEYVIGGYSKMFSPGVIQHAVYFNIIARLVLS